MHTLAFKKLCMAGAQLASRKIICQDSTMTACMAPVLLIPVGPPLGAEGVEPLQRAGYLLVDDAMSNIIDRCLLYSL